MVKRGIVVVTPFIPRNPLVFAIVNFLLGTSRGGTYLTLVAEIGALFGRKRKKVSQDPVVSGAGTG